MSQEGELVYWGGEYRCEMRRVSQKRVMQLKSQLIVVDSGKQKGDHEANDDLGPVLEFQLHCGAPLRSK
jgi:hypothetical protein